MNIIMLTDILLFDIKHGQEGKRKERWKKGEEKGRSTHLERSTPRLSVCLFLIWEFCVTTSSVHLFYFLKNID